MTLINVAEQLDTWRFVWRQITPPNDTCQHSQHGADLVYGETWQSQECFTGINSAQTDHYNEDVNY
jgi:hypothetical protein